MQNAVYECAMIYVALYNLGLTGELLNEEWNLIIRYSHNGNMVS